MHWYAVCLTPKWRRKCANYSNSWKVIKLFQSYECKFLFKYENENYVINFIFDAKLSYEFCYNLFETELDILKNYLLKNLILNCI